MNRTDILPVLLIAACGGSAAPPPAGPTSTSPTTGEEDWRAFLGQIAGSPCTWIPGASFLACIQPAGDPTTTLIGWEANNRRYVAWRIDRDGRVSVMPGTASNAGWLFESPDGTVTLTRDGAGGWTATGLAAADVTIMPDPKAKPPAQTPPLPAQDWRSSLEAFAGDWVFSGTERGADALAQVTCKWIAASTFVACKNSNREAGFDLIGWEPHNGRFALYRFTDTAVDVMVGTKTNKDWTFASPTYRTTWGWDTAIRRNYKEETLGGNPQIVAAGSLETTIE